MDEIHTYEWETDEGWLKIERKLDFGAVSEKKKQVHLLKRKRKYYKKNVNPSYDPSVLIKTETETPEVNDEKATEEPEASPTQETPQPKPTPPKPKPSSSSSTKPKPTAKPSNKRKSNSLQKYLLYSYVVCHLLVVVCSIFVTLGKRSYFTYALLLSFYCHISWVFFKCGRPQRSQEYVQKILREKQSMDAFCAFALWFSPPMIGSLAAPLTRSLEKGFSQAQKLLNKHIPSVGSKLDFLFNPVVSRRQQLIQIGPLIEVWWGVALVAFWPLGMSGIASIFIFWQFLMMKYIVSSACQQAFTQVKYKLGGYVSKVPFLVPYWEKLCAYLYSQVDQQEMMRRAQQAQSGGMMSNLMNRCNIM